MIWAIWPWLGLQRGENCKMKNSLQKCLKSLQSWVRLEEEKEVSVRSTKENKKERGEKNKREEEEDGWGSR